MACILVWDLQQQQQETEEKWRFKDLLARLAGSQMMKRSRSHRDSALLAGRFVLLSLVDLSDQTTNGNLSELRVLVAQMLPFLNTG